MSTFRDAIRSTVGENDNEFLCSELLTAVAAAILAMPEMQAIRSCIKSLAELHYNDGRIALDEAEKHRLRVGLAVGGQLPQSVIDWVLGDQ